MMIKFRYPRTHKGVTFNSFKEFLYNLRLVQLGVLDNNGGIVDPWLRDKWNEIALSKVGVRSRSERVMDAERFLLRTSQRWIKLGPSCPLVPDREIKLHK